MEIKMKNIHMNRISKENVMQITIDEDINMPETKPDIVKILKSSAFPNLVQTRAMEEKLEISGKLEFSILYLTEEENHRINSLNGSIDFLELMNYENANKVSNIKCNIVVEDVSVKIINSRKLSLKAILLIKVLAEEMYDEEIMEDIEGVKEKVEVLKRSIELSHLVVNTNDTIRIKTELTVPNNKPNVDELLYKHFSLKNQDVRCVDNAINISGEMKAFVLYYGNGNSMIGSLEGTIPYSNKLDINGINDDMIACVEYRLGCVDVEVREDEDGESRILSIDAVIELDIKVYEDRTNEIISDIYSPIMDTKLVADNVEFDKILIKNYSKCKLNKNININTQGSKIMQICYADCQARVEETNILDGNIEVLGVATLNLIYIKDNDSEPLGTIKTDIPFSHIIEAGLEGKNVIYTVLPCVEQVITNMLSGEEVELKLNIGLDAIVKERIVENVIRSVEFEKMDSELLMKLPPIIGYVVHDGESLWDIAKKYHTTIEMIKKTNHMQNDKVEKGKKLLIISRVQY